MSDNKEESNSTSSDVKEEEDSSPKTEDVKTDESSKDSEKDSVKNDSVKDESEDESDEEEIGLLDRPVEVSGCRARKKVERLEISFTTSKEKVHSIQDGKGKKLGECPRIELQIQKTSNNELKPLHRILFNRVGGATEIKRNIRKFSGFPFGKNSSEYGRKKAQIEKLTGPVLKQMCAVLDIERSGLKEEIVKRMLEFLLEPKDSGKSVPKKKSSSKDKKKTSAKKGKQVKVKVEAEASDESDVVNDSASDKSNEDDDESKEEESKGEESKDEESKDEESKGEESDEDIDAEIKKKKNAKKPLPKTKKVEKKEKPKKEEKKVSAKGSKRKRGDSEDNSGEPATKKKSPSDDDIKKLVKRILAAADLQEITMKKVIKQVADAYPAYDLSQKKAFIKSTVKSCIS